MKKINPLKNRILLIIALALCCVKLSAQNIITFTWQIPYAYSHEIYIYIDKSFEINWGDGQTENYTGDVLELKHTYATQGEYLVSITADQDCEYIEFECNNANITDLNVNDCNALTLLSCSRNQLTQLNITSPNLEELYCHNNQLTQLNITSPNLKGLYCPYNQLTQLNIMSGLEWLECSHNQLTQLDIYFLQYLDCSYNQLTQLNMMFPLSGYLQYLYCNNNQLTELHLGYPELKDVNCSYNQLTQLNIRFSNLQELDCSHNQLTQLNIESLELWDLYCDNNKLQLSDLYALHLLYAETYKVFGAQNLSPRWTNVNTELFASQSQFNGIYTQYIVEINGAPAPNSSYTVTNGKLTFHTPGIYTVTMTNAAIVSNYPAKVTVPLEVVPVGISENDLADLKVYPNPTAGELRMENGELRIENVEVFDVYGRKLSSNHLIPTSSNHLINISHLQAGVYFVRIQTETGVITKKIIKL